jgi:hypothetical protein
VTDTPITYAYNLSGALVERQYPSGHVVKNVLNNDGTFEIVESKKNANYGYWTYAISFIYTAAGAVSSYAARKGIPSSLSRLTPNSSNILNSTNSGFEIRNAVGADDYRWSSRVKN